MEEGRAVLEAAVAPRPLQTVEGRGALGVLPMHEPPPQLRVLEVLEGGALLEEASLAARAAAHRTIDPQTEG